MTLCNTFGKGIAMTHRSRAIRCVASAMIISSTRTSSTSTCEKNTTTATYVRLRMSTTGSILFLAKEATNIRLSSCSNFDLLRDHYRATHYLCEIGQCKDVQFTNVFASELEFRAHQASLHSKSRAEARQFGTIPVEFQSSSVRDRRQQRDTGHRGEFDA